MSFTPPKTITATIAAGSSKDFDGPGTFVRILSATGALKIGFDLGQPFPTEVGIGYVCQPGENFSRISIEVPGGSAVTFTMIVGRMVVLDDRLHVIGGALTVTGVGVDGTGIVPPAGGSGMLGWLSGIFDALNGGAITIDADLTGVATEATLAKLLVPTQLVDAPDVAVATGAATIVAAAAATRKKIIVCNPSSSVAIRVGSSNVGAARGSIVPPEGSIELETTAAVYVYQASGSGMNIPVLWTLL